jgi:AraC-like DNA-binding protein
VCMSYRELAPPQAVRNSVACLWTRVTGGGSIGVLPDACSDLIWRSGHGAFVAGPDTEPNPASSPAGSVFVGVRFLPGAGGAALGVPLAELRNQRVDTSELRPRLSRRLPPDLTPAEALAELTSIAVSCAAPDPAVRAAAVRLSEPRARVEPLANELGLSERQLRRRFHAAVGYGPKTLQRVLRFRRLLAGLDERADLAWLAADIGYADQAHLSRECTQLSGLSPTALAAGRGARPRPEREPRPPSRSRRAWG